MITILSIVSLVLVLPITIFSGWQLSGKLGATRSHRVIDYVLLSWLVVIVLARILGLIYYSSTLESTTWSLLPVYETNFGIEWLTTWPWLFFNILDGKFMFLDFIAPILLTDYFISMLNQANNKGKFSDIFKQYSVLIYIASAIPFIMALLFNKHLSGQFNPPVWIMLTVSLLLLGIARLFVTDNRIFRLLAIVINIVPLVYINLTKTGDALNFGGAALFVAMIIALELILTVVNLRSPSTSEAVGAEQVVRTSDPRAADRLKKLEEQNFYETSS